MENFTTVMDKKYFAFISYSRKDKVAAEWLQKGMEHFRYPRESVVVSKCPPHKKFVRPIFLDKNELEVSSVRFKEDIEYSLRSSKYLVILCTKNSAHSPWVNAELEYFLKTHNSDLSLVLPIIADEGEINEVFGGFFTPYRERFLQRNLPDMRIQEGETKKVSWNMALSKALSYLLGVSITQIHDRFKQERKRKRFVFVIYGMLFMLMALIAAFSIYLTKHELRQVSTKLEGKAKAAEEEAQKRLEEAKLAQEFAQKKAKEAQEAATEAQRLADEAKIAFEKSKQAEENIKKISKEKQEAEKKAQLQEQELEKMKSKSPPFTPRKVAEISVLDSKKLQEGVVNYDTGSFISYFRKQSDLSTSIFKCIAGLYEYVGYVSPYAFLEEYADSDFYPNLKEKLLNINQFLLSDLELNLINEFSEEFADASIKRGMPLIAAFKNSYADVADKVYQRTERRSQTKKIESIRAILSEKISVADVEQQNHSGLAAVIYGFDEQTGEYIFNYNGKMCSLLKDELAAASLFFVSATLANRHQVALSVPQQEEKSRANPLPASTSDTQNFTSIEKFKQVVKRDKDLTRIPIKFIVNDGMYYEVICDIFQYLNCNPSRDRIKAYAVSGLYSTQRDSIMKINNFLGYNWDVSLNTGFNDKLVKISIDIGIPVLASIRPFAKDKIFWDEVSARKGSVGASSTLKSLFDSSNKRDFSENADAYLTIYGYTANKEYMLNYMGVDYIVKEDEMYMMCRNLYLFKYTVMRSLK